MTLSGTVPALPCWARVHSVVPRKTPDSQRYKLKLRLRRTGSPSVNPPSMYDAASAELTCNSSNRQAIASARDFTCLPSCGDVEAVSVDLSPAGRGRNVRVLRAHSE